MTSTGLLRGDEVFVIDAVARAFSGTWRPGENPHCFKNEIFIFLL